MGWLSVVALIRSCFLDLWFMCRTSRNEMFVERMKRRRSRSGSEISQGSSTYGSSSNLQAEDLFPVENGGIRYTKLLYWKYQGYNIHSGYLAGRFRSIVLVPKQNIPQLESSCLFLCRLYLAERSQVTQQAGSEDDGV